MKVLFASKALMRHPAPLDVVRLRIIDAVSNATGESRGGALFLSMAFGVRDVLSPPVEALFTNLGLSHLLVVSGYQVSLVFGGVLSLLLGVGRTLRASLGMRTVGIVASLMCASVYVIAIGSEMSSVRALVAAICLCISLLMNRRHGFAQRLVATFLCMHIVWPWALCEIGVVLTFAALSGIGIGSVLGAGGRLRSLVWVTVSVWGMTSVVTVVWNGALSVSGLFLNLLLAAPWSILNCTVGVGALALELAGVPGAAIALRGVGSANEVIVAVLFWLQGIIGSSREAALVERGVTALALVGTCWGMAAAAVRLAQAESMRSMVRGTPGPRQQR
jgi:ComEC/Rec2-related protein